MSSLPNHATDLQAASAAQTCSTRVLCLGNELLGDDALGCMVAEHLRQAKPPDVEVLSTLESGFHLLDYVLNTRRLIVVDAVLTGNAPAGTIYVFHDSDLTVVPGGSPHYVGLYEVLALSRRLGLPVAEEVVILAVEAAESSTLGGAMHPAVRAAVPALAGLVRDVILGRAVTSAVKTENEAA